MTFEKKTRSRGFLAGVLVGAVLGAAAALLWSPQSGQSIRRSLKDQGRGAADRLSSLLEEASDLVDRATTAVPTIGDREKKVRGELDRLRRDLAEIEATSSHS